MTKCYHDHSPQSTLHTYFTAEVSLNQHPVRFYYVKCHVCNQYTDLCLFPEEANKRAICDLWFDSDRILEKV